MENGLGIAQQQLLKRPVMKCWSVSGTDRIQIQCIVKLNLLFRHMTAVLRQIKTYVIHKKNVIGFLNLTVVLVE